MWTDGGGIDDADKASGGDRRQSAPVNSSPFFGFG